MRVLQLISSGGMYGAEAVILNLARGLNASGHHSTLGVFANGDVQLHHVALANHLESHVLPCAGQFDPGMLKQLRELVREHNIDVVHAHGYKADVYAYVAFRGTRTALVSTCHNWLNTDLKVRAYGALDRFVLRRFSAVAVVSKALATTLEGAGLDATKLQLIPNGIDVVPFQEAARAQTPAAGFGRALRVGLIGRLSPEKGIDLFLQAAALVLREQTHVQFLIAGDGPEHANLEALATQLGIAQSVSFLGRSDRMPELLASLDLVVSASRFEGLPMTILESMASGRPIVATAVGEIPTVLNSGSAGMLVPPDDTSALAQAMLTLLRNAELRQTYSLEAARRVMAHYSARQMTAQYLKMYTAAYAAKTMLLEA